MGWANCSGGCRHCQMLLFPELSGGEQSCHIRRCRSGCLAVRLSGALLELTGRLWRTTGSLDTIALRGSRSSLTKQFQRQISCPNQQAWSLLSAQDPLQGKTKAIHPSKVLRSGISPWGKGREKILSQTAVVIKSLLLLVLFCPCPVEGAVDISAWQASHAKI